MPDFTLFTTLTVFSMTVLFLMWRPGGLHESVPTAIGAVVNYVCEELIFVPSMLSIGMISLLLYLYFRRTIPRRITVILLTPPPPNSVSIPHAYYNQKTVERWINKGENHTLKPDKRASMKSFQTHRSPHIGSNAHAFIHLVA